MEMTELDLATVIRSAVGMTALSASGRGIEVRLHLVTDPARILGDRVRLLQVVWNLLSNAVKFTSTGGQIDVLLERDGSGNARLAIHDTGLGISADFLPHVFELYQQEMKAGAMPGLGIGLSIVAQIVKLHGGTVSVESAGLGHGSTFIVKLPLLDPSEVSVSRSQGGGRTGRSRRTEDRRAVQTNDRETL